MLGSDPAQCLFRPPQWKAVIARHKGRYVALSGENVIRSLSMSNAPLSVSPPERHNRILPKVILFAAIALLLAGLVVAQMVYPEIKQGQIPNIFYTTSGVPLF